MLKALQAVEANRGAAGMDGMEVGQLRSYLQKRWAGIKEQLLNGSYEPRLVRRVDIPKPGGGTRMLGIPTVLAGLIQQRFIKSSVPYGSLSSHRTAMGFDPDAARHRRSKQRRVMSTPAKAGWWTWKSSLNHDVLMTRVGRWVKEAHAETDPAVPAKRYHARWLGGTAKKARRKAVPCRRCYRTFC